MATRVIVPTRPNWLQHEPLLLQPELELQPSIEPGSRVPTATWLVIYGQAVRLPGPRVHARELEARVGAGPLVFRDGRPFLVEIRPIQGAGGFRSDGLLRKHRQRGGRDVEAQHGPHLAPRVPQHHHVAPQHEARHRGTVR